MASTLDFIIIGIFALSLLAVGFYASCKITNNTDFALAGRNVKFPLLLGTLIGTSIGAASTLGKAGKAYEIGIALFFATMAYAVGLFLFGLMAPAIHRAKIWNVPDVLFLRYGSGVRLVFAITMLLSVTALFGTQLIATGLAITSVMTDIDVTYQQAIIAAGAIMVIYTILGGLLAVAYTDLLQTLVMLIAIGIILPIYIVSDLGIDLTISYLTPPEDNFWGGLTPIYIVSIVIIDLLFSLIDPSLWQRAAAAKNPQVIRKAMFVTSGVYLYWSLVIVFLGTMASHILPELARSSGGVDAAIPELILLYMPVGLKGLCLAAMMAIMMSTADTALLIAGTCFSRDIYRSLNPTANDATLLKVTRIVIIIIGVLGIVFALNMQNIFELVLLSTAIFVSGAFVPTMAALFWRKATKQGAIISSSVAAISVIVLYALKMSDLLPHYIEPIIVSISVSLVLMLVVSHITFDPKTAIIRLLDISNNKLQKGGC